MRRLFGVARHAGAGRVSPADMILRARIAPIGGLAVPEGSHCRVGAYAAAGLVTPAELDLGGDQLLGRGALEPSRGGGGVLGDSLARGVGLRKLELGHRVALAGRAEQALDGRGRRGPTRRRGAAIGGRGGGRWRDRGGGFRHRRRPRLLADRRPVGLRNGLLEARAGYLSQPDGDTCDQNHTHESHDHRAGDRPAGPACGLASRPGRRGVGGLIDHGAAVFQVALAHLGVCRTGGESGGCGRRPLAGLCLGFCAASSPIPLGGLEVAQRDPADGLIDPAADGHAGGPCGRAGEGPGLLVDALHAPRRCSAHRIVSVGLLTQTSPGVGRAFLRREADFGRG